MHSKMPPCLLVLLILPAVFCLLGFSNRAHCPEYPPVKILLQWLPQAPFLQGMVVAMQATEYSVMALEAGLPLTRETGESFHRTP